LIGRMRRHPETEENYMDMRRDFHSARLEAMWQAGKKGMCECSETHS